MSRRGVVLALRVAVAAGMLALLWWALDGAELLARLRGAHPGWVALAVALLVAQTVLSALRWRATAAALGQAIGAGRAVREYFLGVLANMALPGGVVGDAARAVRARDAGRGLGGAVQAVVIERLAGQVMLAAVVLAGLAVWPLVPGWVPLAGLAACAVAVLVMPRLPGLRVIASVLARAWLRDGAWRAQLGYSLAITGCSIGAFAAAATAVGAGVPVAALVVLPLTLAAMLIPVGVAGWGLREGAAAVLWPLAGLAPEAGVAASVVYGLAALASALPGLLFLPGPAAPPLSPGAGTPKG